MTLVKSDVTQLLTVGLNKDFMTSVQEAEKNSLYTTVCTVIQSTKTSEKYGWLGSVPSMKEWVDERQAEGLSEYSFEIPNTSYEATISVDRDTLEDEQYGQIRLRVSQLADEAQRYFDEKVMAVLEANGVAYDSQNFFDTDHSSGSSGTYSNAPAANATYDFTTANGAAVAKLVVAAMRRFKNDKGRPFGSRPTHVLVPPELEFTARELFDPSWVNLAQTGASIVSMKGYFKVIVSDYLTADATVEHSKVYWLDLSHKVKPLILQMRQAPKFTALDKDDDWANFMRKEIYYGVETRFGVGYGEHRYAYRTIGA